LPAWFVRRELPGAAADPEARTSRRTRWRPSKGGQTAASGATRSEGQESSRYGCCLARVAPAAKSATGHRETGTPVKGLSREGRRLHLEQSAVRGGTPPGVAFVWPGWLLQHNNQSLRQVDQREVFVGRIFHCIMGQLAARGKTLSDVASAWPV